MHKSVRKVWRSRNTLIEITNLKKLQGLQDQSNLSTERFKYTESFILQAGVVSQLSIKGISEIVKSLPSGALLGRELRQRQSPVLAPRSWTCTSWFSLNSVEVCKSNRRVPCPLKSENSVRTATYFIGSDSERGSREIVLNSYQKVV